MGVPQILSCLQRVPVVLRWVADLASGMRIPGILGLLCHGGLPTYEHAACKVPGSEECANIHKIRSF